MAQIIGFNLSKEDYFNLADEAFIKGDSEKSISYLNKALSIDDRFYEASLALATVYASLGVWDISNATLYKTLSKKPDEETRGRIFYQLATNFMDINQPEVAEYYLQDIADAYDIQMPENFGSANDNEGDFHIIYPKGEDYCEMLIERAYELVRERKFDEAISILDEVDPRSKSKNAANHVVLVCLMMKNDLDSVIANAQKMLAENGDSLAIKCTLSTAYLMEDKVKEAYEVLDDILKKDYTNMEDILMLLPILVNMEMHADVVKYTRRVLERLDLQQNTMIWLSQGLYNLGQREEARKVMVKVRNIFGEFSPADYFLELYKTEPEKVAYSMNLPYIERMRRYKILDAVTKLSPAELSIVAAANDDDSVGIKKLIEWAFSDDNENLKFLLLDKLALVDCEWVDEFIKKQLIGVDNSFELTSRLMFCLVHEKSNKFFFNFDVVAQDRYKSIRMVLPNAFYKMPVMLRRALFYCLSDIVFTDEEPNAYLAKLTDIINGIVCMDGDKAKYTQPSYYRISAMKSMRTLVGVLLAKVYEDDDPDMRNITIDRYGLDKKLFDKYYKIVFGDDDGRQ